MPSEPIESMISELDLFSRPVVQVSALSGDWITYRPVQAIGQQGPITFVVPGSGDAYIDMSKTLLYIKCRVINGNTNARYVAANDYSVVNNMLNSLFSEIRVDFNQQTVSSSNNLNHYRSYIENLYNFNQTAKDSHLTSSLFYMDEAGKFEDATGAGFVKRQGFVKTSAEVDLFGRIHCDVLNTSKYLLNEVEMRLTFTQNPGSLVAFEGVPAAGVAPLNPKIEITEAMIFIRKVNLNPSILLAHEKMLQTTPAIYPFKRVEMLSYSIPAGTYKKCFENLFLNKIPSRIILGLVKNSAFSGGLHENCYNFDHFNLNYLNLSVNGHVIGCSNLSPNYGSKKSIIPYLFSYYNCGNPGMDDGNCVDRESYPNGYCLYAFDLSPDLSASESHFSPQQQGSVRLDLGFSLALTQVVNVVVHAEYADVMEIDRDRQIVIQYKK
jgi:hypothetical protein